jgi:hypothetical protein
MWKNVASQFTHALPGGRIMANHDDVAKNFAQMTHAERLAALTRELAAPSSVATAKALLNLMEEERRDVVAVRDRAIERHGGSAGLAAGNAAAASESATGIATLGDLVKIYLQHEDSPYRGLRFRTRKSYDANIARILADCGKENLSAIKGADMDRLRDLWTENGQKQAMGHAIVAMLRILINFGATVLDDPNCARISVLLRHLGVSAGTKPSDPLTEAHARAIIQKAHQMGRASIALAQALQFDGRLRQTDTIGEWVPHSEPGVSDVTEGKEKWLRGVRWNMIDRNRVLRHVTMTSKGPRDIEIDLRKAPLVKAEFERLSTLPDSGPMIIDEDTDKPFAGWKFRRLWRQIANAAGVPETVKNMDSRVGEGQRGRAPADQERRKKLRARGIPDVSGESQ